MEKLFKKWRNNEITTQDIVKKINDTDDVCNDFKIIKKFQETDIYFFTYFSDDSIYKILLSFYYCFQTNDLDFFVKLRINLEEKYYKYLICIIEIYIKNFPTSENLAKLCLLLLENYLIDSYEWFSQNIQRNDYFLKLFEKMYKYCIKYVDYDTRLSLLSYLYNSSNFDLQVSNTIFKCFKQDKELKKHKITFFKNIIIGIDKIPKENFDILTIYEKKKLFKLIVQDIFNPYSELNMHLKTNQERRNVLDFIYSIIPKTMQQRLYAQELKKISKENDKRIQQQINEALSSFTSQLKLHNVSSYSFNDLIKICLQINDKKLREKMYNKIKTFQMAINIKRFKKK